MRVTAPKHLRAAQAQLAALQRKAARQHGPYDPTTRRRQTPSAGWLTTQKRIARAHARVSNLRRNHLHHATAALASGYEIIGIEHLNVRGMMAAPKPRQNDAGGFDPNGRAAKSGLARSVGDASFGELLRQLTYKTSWAGGHTVQADMFFPSSKTCSGCGAVKTKLPLSARVYHCDECGRSTDRDLNAAINLARLAAAEHTTAPGPGSGLVSGRGTGTHPRTRADRTSPNEAATPPAPRGLPHHKSRAQLNPPETPSQLA